MSQSNRAFPELALSLGRFTVSTRARLSRSLVRALRGQHHVSHLPLNEAITDGCRELRAAGLSDRDITAFFGALVEETGRACGADRPSLISGQLRWEPVRDRVLEIVGDALSVPAPEPFLLMDHRNGPR
ncbi:MAG TPA: hypothetical protein VGP95_09800 [Gemmatimonadaceae bacterium]|nr:hypothetical protein [Gemmatimonadaceae bacterium]